MISLREIENLYILIDLKCESFFFRNFDSIISIPKQYVTFAYKLSPDLFFARSAEIVDIKPFNPG